MFNTTCCLFLWPDNAECSIPPKPRAPLQQTATRTLPCPSSWLTSTMSRSSPLTRYVAVLWAVVSALIITAVSVKLYSWLAKSWSSSLRLTPNAFVVSTRRLSGCTIRKPARRSYSLPNLTARTSTSLSWTRLNGSQSSIPCLVPTLSTSWLEMPPWRIPSCGTWSVSNQALFLEMAFSHI